MNINVHFATVWMEGDSFHALNQSQRTQFWGLFVFVLKIMQSEFPLTLAQHYNLSLSLPCRGGSWILFLTACNTLFHCMLQNLNYRPVLLQTRLDTICCHEYLIRCQRECSKYSPSSVFFFLLFLYRACTKPTHGNKSYLCTFYVWLLWPRNTLQS